MTPVAVSSLMGDSIAVVAMVASAGLAGTVIAGAEFGGTLVTNKSLSLSSVARFANAIVPINSNINPVNCVGMIACKIYNFHTPVHTMKINLAGMVGVNNEHLDFNVAMVSTPVADLILFGAFNCLVAGAEHRPERAREVSRSFESLKSTGLVL